MKFAMNANMRTELSFGMTMFFTHGDIIQSEMSLRKTVRAMFSISTKWLSNSVLAVCIIVLISKSASAQVEQTARYEIPVSSWDQDFSIIPASVHGLYLNRVVAENRD